RRGVALMDKVFGAAEVHVRIVLHVGDDDDVGVLNVQIDVAFNEEVQGQLQIGQEVVVIDVFEFLLDVDRDDHVGAAVAVNVGGDGVFHPAVDVVAAVDGNGREYAGYGHAGDERLGQTARLHHEFVARYDVRHHGVEGALQVFDLRAARQVVEEFLERVGIEHGTPGRNVQGEQGRELDFSCQRGQVVRRESGRVQARYDAAHARADDHVHRNAFFFQCLKEPDVADTPRRAPTQHDGNGGPGFLACCGGRIRLRHVLCRGHREKKFHRPRTDNHGEKADKKESYVRPPAQRLLPPRS